MKLLDLIKQFGQANYNYSLFNGSDKLQKQFDAERMDLFNQIVKQVKVEPEVMPKAEFTPIVAHVVIKNKIAEEILEKVCSGNEFYIDYTQSLTSYKVERK